MIKSQMQPETLISSEMVFQGKLLSVRCDTVRLFDGREVTKEVVGHRPVVVIVAIDKEDNVVMVRQFRYAVGETLLETPAGIVEESELPVDSAERELREETGYASRNLQPLGQFWASPGFCDELIYAYVARKLVFSPLEPDVDENIQIERVPLLEVTKAISQGKIRDAKTIAALLMAIGDFSL